MYKYEGIISLLILIALLLVFTIFALNIGNENGLIQIW